MSQQKLKQLLHVLPYNHTFLKNLDIFNVGDYTMVTAVTDANFDAEVLKSSTPVLVDFWADWCGPCKMLAPIFQDLAKEYTGKLKFVKFDVDAGERASEFGVMSIPTMILFHKGKEVDRMVGALPKDRLKAQFDSWLKGLK